MSGFDSVFDNARSSNVAKAFAYLRDTYPECAAFDAARRESYRSEQREPTDFSKYTEQNSAGGDGDLDPVDLGPFLRGEHEPILPRLLVPLVAGAPHSIGLLYRANLNFLFGDSGSGKTWIALVAAVEEILAGRNVTWIHLEDPTPQILVDRLLQLGLSPEQISKHFRYVAPINALDRRRATKLLESISTDELVVFDSLGEAFALSSVNEDKDSEVGPWIRDVLRTLSDGGATVVVIDHIAKAAESPMHPSGSKRKRAAITGAMYLIEGERELSKADGGVIRIVTAKDRHGNWTAKKTAAKWTLTPWPDGTYTHRLDAVTGGSDSGKSHSNAETMTELAIKFVEILKERRGVKTNRGQAITRFKELHKPSRNMDLYAGLDEAIGNGAIAEKKGLRTEILLEYVKPWEPRI
jgi:hypothetical protein